jgi:hypothetical protein
MTYTILTASAVESNRIQQTRWASGSCLVPVSLLGRKALRGITGDLFYTDAALDALVRSADVEGREWEEWRNIRHAFASVRPYEAWEYLHEASAEHLAERGRSRLAVLNVVTHIPADRPTHSYLDLINFERRHAAAAVKAKAADHLIRIAPRRVIVTEAQYGGVVEVRATWTALPAAHRKAPEWLVDAAHQLDNESSVAGV